MSENTLRSRRKIRLTREGLYFFFILCFIVFGSVLRQIGLLFMLAGLMIVPLILNWRFVMSSVYALNPRRRTNQTTSAGQTTLVEWQMKNSHRWLTSWAIKIKDEIKQLEPGDETQRSEVELLIPQVASGETVSGTYRLHFGNRGIYELGPANISTAFPVGLLQGSYNFFQSSKIYVGPRLGVLTPVWHQRMQSLVAGDQSNQRRRGIEQDEFYALRPWKSGDSLRWIHWRSSARTGKITVKQFDQKGDRDFALLFDCWMKDDTVVNRNNVELAASFTATILSELEHFVKGQVAVSLCGDKPILAIGQINAAFVQELTKALATIKPSSETHLQESLLDLAARTSVGTPLIVISTRSQPTFENAYGLESAISRIDWVQTGTQHFEELFQFDQKSYRDDLMSIFKSQDQEDDNSIPVAEAKTSNSDKVIKDV